jgi:hypothetical protein
LAHIAVPEQFVEVAVDLGKEVDHALGFLRIISGEIPLEVILLLGLNLPNRPQHPLEVFVSIRLIFLLSLLPRELVILVESAMDFRPGD